MEHQAPNGSFSGYRTRPNAQSTALAVHGVVAARAKRRDRLGPSLSPPPSEKRRRQSLLELESAGAGLGHPAGPPSSEAEAVPARSPSLSQLRRKAGPDQAPARSERVSDSGHSAGGGPTRTAGAEARGRPRARADVRARAATRAAKGGVSEGLNHSELPSATSLTRPGGSGDHRCEPVGQGERLPRRMARLLRRRLRTERPGPRSASPKRRRRRPRSRCAPAAHPRRRRARRRDRRRRPHATTMGDHRRRSP